MWPMYQYEYYIKRNLFWKKQYTVKFIELYFCKPSTEKIYLDLQKRKEQELGQHNVIKWRIILYIVWRLNMAIKPKRIKRVRYI